MPRSFLIYLTASFLGQAREAKGTMCPQALLAGEGVGVGVQLPASYQVDGDAPFVAIALWFGLVGQALNTSHHDGSLPTPRGPTGSFTEAPLREMDQRMSMAQNILCTVKKC